MFFSLCLPEKGVVATYQFTSSPPSQYSPVPPIPHTALSSSPPMSSNSHVPHVCSDTMFLSCRPAAAPPSTMSISPMGSSAKLYDHSDGQSPHAPPPSVPPGAGMCAMSATSSVPVLKVSVASSRTDARPWAVAASSVVVLSTPRNTWPEGSTRASPAAAAAVAER